MQPQTALRDYMFDRCAAIILNTIQVGHLCVDGAVLCWKFPRSNTEAIKNTLFLSYCFARNVVVVAKGDEYS
jgi:hypothetical protein